MNKDCTRFSVELSVYFDGEMEEAAEKQMEAHLRSCAACRENLDKLKRLRNALTHLAEPSPGKRSILEDLRAKLNKGGEPEGEIKKPIVS